MTTITPLDELFERYLAHHHRRAIAVSSPVVRGEIRFTICRGLLLEFVSDTIGRWIPQSLGRCCARSDRAQDRLLQVTGRRGEFRCFARGAKPCLSTRHPQVPIDGVHPIC